MLRPLLAAAALSLLAAPALAEPADRPSAARFLSATAGDVACYLRVIAPSGAELELLADFALCEQDASLAGRNVALAYEQANVIAASCEGDPECQDSETVWIVAKMTPTGR